jgi:streptogrisin C
VSTRLAAEARAGGTSAGLRRDLGTRYGGAWLAADGTTLMIAVTDEAAAAKVRAAGAEPKLVTWGEPQLDTLKSKMDRNAARSGDGIVGWHVDPATNRVVVTTRPGAETAARSFATASGVAADAVRVQVSGESPRLLFDVRGGDPYFINNQARCSIGFAVQGGFVTAGHCGDAGNSTTGFNRAAQGTFQASSFPGDDWGVVRVNANWVPTATVNSFGGANLPVAGAQEAVVGASICKFGSTTGMTCGVVQARNASVSYPEGTVTGLTRTNVCAEPGDSGGPWLSGSQAQGVTSGGSGNCTTGGTTFFQPIGEILQRNNLTLVVTGGTQTPPPTTAPPTVAPPTAAPPTTAPPSSACTGTLVRRGSLAGTGQVQVQPDGRFYRTARAGTQQVCLDGPDGADFDLSLQRWTGSRWTTVARALGPASDERISFNGPAAFYRVRVQSGNGAGAYTVAITGP